MNDAFIEKMSQEDLRAYCRCRSELDESYERYINGLEVENHLMVRVIEVKDNTKENLYFLNQHRKWVSEFESNMYEKYRPYLEKSEAKNAE